MSVTVQTALTLKHASAAELFARGEVIETDDVKRAIVTPTYVYASSGRRVLCQGAWVSTVTTTNAAASRVIVYEGWTRFATDRAKVSIVARGTNMSLLVDIQTPAGASLGSTTITGSGTQTGSITTGITQEDVLVVISMGHDGTSPASLVAVRVLEQPMVAGDLP